jgi:AraC-like DNA-binding protein
MTRRKSDPPRGVLKTAFADDLRFRHARYHPSRDLAVYVEHFWAVAWDLRGQPSERTETLPHPSVHMIFERNVGGRIAGIAHGKFARQLEGEGGVFATKFTPGGFYPFAGVPISTLTDRVVSLTAVFGADAATLERDVLSTDAGADADAQRISIVEDFLRGRSLYHDEHVPRISEIVYAVARDRTILKVEDLVGRYELPKRTLQRLFAKYVGVSPKWVIQRYRLHEAAEQLAADADVAQSALALELGYSDQAHFVRDFKAVVGTSPASYARRSR